MSAVAPHFMAQSSLSEKLQCGVCGVWCVCAVQRATSSLWELVCSWVKHPHMVVCGGGGGVLDVLHLPLRRPRLSPI